MKTIEINLYKFEELSEEAKKHAVEKSNEGETDNAFVCSEARETVEAFCDVFNVSTRKHDWLNFGTSNIDYLDEVLEFSPERLKKYIINNCGEYLTTGKYYSLWSKKDQNPHYTKNGSAPWGKLKTRHSKIIMVEKNCALTGTCYDESILSPIYAFLDGSNYQLDNILELFNSCFEELKKDIDNEIESMQSFEYISETLIANDYDFTENGNMY